MGNTEFNYLIAINANSLRGFAYHFTRNTEDSEDLLQDTLLKALRYKNHFQEGTNFRGWLFTIMRNIFINNCKRKKLQRQFSNGLMATYQLQGFGVDMIGNTINTQDINKAINMLSPDYEKPFRMHIEGYQYDEIAAEMNIPMGTVKSRIFNARKKLAGSLQEFC